MQKIQMKAKPIKLVIFDVDGILTDGLLYYTDNGVDIKAFNVHDGMGIKLLQQTGVTVGIITSHNSPLINLRMEALKVPHVYSGQEEKLPAFYDLLAKLKLQREQVCYVGDDLPDLPLMKRVGLSITVPNATSLIRKHADWQTQAHGGRGAVREICEMIMRAQDTLDEQLTRYLQ